MWNCAFAIQSNIDFVIDNKMNAALMYNVSQDNKAKILSRKRKGIWHNHLIRTNLKHKRKRELEFQGMGWDDKWNWKFDKSMTRKNKFWRKSQYEIENAIHEKNLDQRVFLACYNYIIRNVWHLIWAGIIPYCEQLKNSKKLKLQIFKYTSNIFSILSNKM